MNIGNNFSNYYGNNNMYRNEYDNSNGSGYENPKFAPQLMVDKQKQSLKYSYETLGNLLSAAENFAGLANEKYGSYNYSNSKDYNGLKSEFAWELECFSLAMETYQKKYGPYQFPPDCPKEKILNEIKIYIQRMKDKDDKKLYYMMADIINGNKVKTNFKELYEGLDENANRKFDPRKMNHIIGPLNQILDQAENDAAEGNMDLLSRNKATERAKEQLKNLPKERFKLIKVTIGIPGTLISQDHHLYFINNMNNSRKVIKIAPSKIKSNTYYNINRSILYVGKSFSDCELYSPENEKTIYENCIVKNRVINLNDVIYNLGTYIDQKQQYNILYQENDLK